MGKALVVTTIAIVGIAGIVALNYFDAAEMNGAPTAEAPSNGAVANIDAEGTENALTVLQTKPQAAAENIENAAPVLTDANSGVAISDDGDTLSFATVQITGASSPSERLSVNLEGTDLRSAFDGETKTLTISGVASLQDYETALKNIAFDAPAAGNADRTLQVIVNDGELASDPAFVKAALQTVGDEDDMHDEDAAEEEDEKAMEADHGDHAPEAKEDMHDADSEKDVLETGDEHNSVQ